MNNYLVSVIIPTYNREYTLERAINSVFSQSYSNIELIIIDDNSTDQTEEKIQKYLHEASIEINIFYKKNSKNLGATASRNIGASIAEGEFLAFLDSDDEWNDEKIQKQIDEIQKDDSIGLVFTGLERINTNTNEKYKITPEKINYTSDDIFINDPIGSNSGPLIRRSFFEQAGKYDEKLPSRQDWDLWIRLSRVSNICSLNYIGYFYYYGREDQISSGIQRKFQGTKMVFNKYYKEFLRNKKAYGSITRSLSLMALKANDKKEALRYIRESIKVDANLEKRIFKYMLKTFGINIVNKTYSAYSLLKNKRKSYLDW